MWLELSRRGIHFDVIVSGNPIGAVTSSSKEDYKYKTDMQTIVYSNSKQQAVGTISAAMESVLEQSPNDREVIPLTGDDGLQFKVYTMHAFSQEADAIANTINESDPLSLLPNLKIMPATKAADCGVSSKRCRRSYRIGLAPSIYLLVQEMGRVDRDPLAGIGDNRYEVYLSFSCAVKLFVRIMQHPDSDERLIQLASMREVLRLLVTPKECQHTLMEQYFEQTDSTLEKVQCTLFCSQCKHDTRSLTGRIHRNKLSQLLITFSTGRMQTTDALIKFIKSNKKDIFHKNDIPHKMMGPIHALCLQLFAKGIIELGISDDKKNLIGKTDLSPLNVVVRLGIQGNDPAVLIDSFWEGLHLVCELSVN